MSLRFKVVLILSLVFLVGGFWSYRAVYNNIRPQYLRVMEDAMVGQTYLLSKQIEFELPSKDPHKALSKLRIRTIMKHVRSARVHAKIYEWARRTFDYRIYITDARGIVRLDTDNSRDVGMDYSKWNDVYRALRGKYGARSSREYNSRGQMINALYTAFPIYKNKKRIGVVTLVKSKSSITGWAQRAQAKLWKGVLLGASVLFTLALLLTQFALNPITRLTEYAKDIAAGRRVQAPPVGKDEIGQLTQAFVEMKQALWERRDIEQFVTQLTHELKSPICAIQGAAELLEDPSMKEDKRTYFLANITEQSKRMDDIVQRLLRLVALEQQEHLEHKRAIEVNELLDNLRSRFTAQAEHKGIQLDITSTMETLETFQGDPFLLQQALTNILQNSFHFTPPNGEIQLSVCLERHLHSTLEGKASSTLSFQITDTGPGIPEYAAERVMEKFYSLEHPDTGRKGTGLGLPFVHQVALLHGGDFTLINRDSQGALATLWLPIFDEE